MSDRTWTKIAAASGIVFVVCVLISAFIAGAPVAASDTPEDVTNFFVDNSSKLLTGVYFQGLGAISFALFVGLLYRRLADAGSISLAVSLVVAAAFTGAVVAVAQVTVATLAFRTAEAGNTDLTLALFDATLMAYNIVAFGMAAIAAAAGLAIIQHAAMSRWLGYGGLISAVVNLVSGGSFAKDGLFEAGGVLGLVGFIGFLAFILVASVMMLLESAKEPASAA